MNPLIRELEEIAFAAWPAAQVEEIDGWRCRHTPPGITRRANSVWPGDLHERRSFDERLAAVEDFYTSRGASACFQITRAALPQDLDAVLAERGWTREAAVSIQIGEAVAVAKASPLVPGMEASVSDELEDDWFEVAGRRSRFGTAQEAYRGILARIGPRAGFALVRESGEPVAAGLGVRDGDWVGVFSMFTCPEHRGRGLARTLLGELARWTIEGGARRIYLQVERDNPAALALYKSAGFEELYGYHYRRKFF